MKANILRISVSLMALLIGMSSCQDAMAEKDEFREEVTLKTGGKDADGPMVLGLAIDFYGEPLYPALIALHEQGGQALDSTNTEEDGEFHFHLEEEGNYYLKVYQNEQLVGTSQTVEVTDSSYVILQF